MASLEGKRVLYVITKSNWGGAQAYVYAFARHAKAEGADVAVALGGTGLPGSDTGILAARLTECGVRIVVVASLARDITHAHEWRAYEQLRDLIRSERPDVLHLNSSKAGALGALAGRIARVPRIIFTAHGWAHREPRSLPWRTFVRFASWLTIVLSHVVIVVSERDRTTAPALFFKRKLRVIHNGVTDFSPIPRDGARRFLAPTLAPLARLTKWLLLPAELTRNKGVDLAIRAFAGVSTNVDDAALVIVGEGEEHQALTELIANYGLEKRAFLLGFVPDVRQYLAAADVFLMPSRKEGFPLALLEAGHAGLPVIVTATGGIPEIVEHEKNGLLIRPNDIDGLADAMTRLLLNPDEAVRFGTELQKKVRESFLEEEMLSKTRDVYS